MIPIPKLVAFYNGQEEYADQVLELSDLFDDGVDASQSDVTVRVRMINITPNRNKALLSQCQPLYEYSWFIEKINQNKKTMELKDAVDEALDSMPEDFVIRGYLMLIPYKKSCFNHAEPVA